MKLVSFLIQKSRGVFIFAVLAGIISGAASALLLALVNHALNHEADGPGVYAWIFLGLCLFVPVTHVASHLMLVRIGESSVSEMRVDLIRRILATPLAKLEEIGAPRLLVTLTEDTMAIANGLVLFPTIIISFLVVLGSLVYLGSLSLTVLGVFVPVLTLVGVVVVLVVRVALKRYRGARDKQDGLFKHFRALTEGGKELKLHARRRRAFVQLGEKTAHELRDLYISGATIAGFAQAYAQMLVFAVVGFLVFVLPQLQVIDRETLTGYTMVLFYIIAPFQLMLQSMPLMSRGGIALRKVEQMGLSLVRPDSETRALTPTTSSSGWRSLEFFNVVYNYRREGENHDFNLGPVDLAFEPNEIVFLVGGNGSGKTTLAKLFTGLYTPQAGEIRLDGELIDDDNLDLYRQHFSMVFSDFYLFDSLLGLENAELDQQSKHYLEELELDHKVRVEDGVLSTTALSQGQRKRLALLTAYLEDRLIYVFDEWAADQDPVFKEIFYRQLLPDLKARGKSLLVISHDDRYYDAADRIVKLEDGRVKPFELEPSRSSTRTRALV